MKSTLTHSIRNITALFIVLLGISFLSLKTIAVPGCAWETHDMLFNMERYAATTRCLADGQFLAQWSRDINYGYGYPLLLFYPPLSVFIVSTLHLAGVSILESTRFFVFFCQFLTGLLGFILGKNLWKSRSGALLTAIASMLLPYHLLTVMTRGALAEFAGQALVPGVLWSWIRLNEKNNNSPHRMIVAALFSVLLLLTHNATWLLLTPLTFLLALVQGKFTTRTLIRTATALALGMGLGAWHWIPAFTEKSYVKISNLLNASHLSYVNHFANLEKIISEPWAYAGIGTVLSIGWIISLPGLYKIRTQNKNFTVLVTLATATPVIILLTTKAGKPVWDLISILQYVQFPWRLTAIAGITAAAVLPAITKLSSSRIYRWSITAIFTAALLYTAQSQCNRPIFKFNDRSGLSVEHLNTSGTTTVVADEYQPLSVKTHPFKKFGLPMSPWTVNQNPEYKTAVICVPTQDKSNEISAFFISDYAFTVQVNCVYFPGWKAFLNNEDIPVTPDPVTGLMRLEIPEGDHFVSLKFTQTPVRTFGVFITLLSFLFILFFCLRYKS